MDDWNDNPGPGTYYPQDRAVSPQAPAYSIAKKSRLPAGGDQPGPGTYSPCLGSTGPAYSIPGRYGKRGAEEGPG